MNGYYKGRMFKESFRGFNKEDVTNFIDSISHTYNTNLLKLEEDIEKLRKDLTVAEKENERLISDSEANKKIIDELNEKIKAQDDHFLTVGKEDREDGENQEEFFKAAEGIENLLNENNSLKEQNEKCAADLERLNASLNELIKNSENNVIIINVEGDADAESKKAVYDTVMTSLGKIILSTEKEAAEIINAAKEKACVTLSQAESSANNILSAAKEESVKLERQNSDVLSKIRERNQKLIIEYSVAGDNAKKDYESLVKNLADMESYLTELESDLEA